MSSPIFRPDRGGRRDEGEIRAAAREAHGAALVNGLDQVTEAPPAGRPVACRPAWRAALPGGDAWRVRLRDGERLGWVTYPVPSPLDARSAVVVFAVAMGNGSPLPQPTGHFELLLDDETLLSFRIVKHPEVWRRGDASLCLDVRRLDAAKPGHAVHLGGVREGETREGEAPAEPLADAFGAFGYALLRLPADRVKPGLPLRLAIVARCPVPSERWFQIEKDPGLIAAGQFAGGLERVGRRPAHWRLGSFRLLFGDLHSHSGVGRAGDGSGSGAGTPRENFLYARDVANLDLYALTDHDRDLASSADWESRCSLAQEFYKPGGFVTLPAFEWSSERYGHRGVYYADSDQPYFLASRDDPWDARNDTPDELWRKLDELGTDALTIPFHPASAAHPTVWEYRSAKHEPVAEIYSSLGSAEAGVGASRPEVKGGGDRVAGCDLRAALAAGLRLGFVASSNSHDGHPGDAQGGRLPAYFHHLGSGRIALLAKECTRTSVFEAIRSRRVYATTGEPIFLDFRLNDHLMGSELTPDQAGKAPELLVRAIGTCEIEMVQILCNGRVAGIQFGEGMEEGIAIRDSSFVPGQPRCYYARVIQRDGEMAWSSPIWVG